MIWMNRAALMPSSFWINMYVFFSCKKKTYATNKKTKWNAQYAWAQCQSLLHLFFFFFFFLPLFHSFLHVLVQEGFRVFVAEEASGVGWERAHHGGCKASEEALHAVFRHDLLCTVDYWPGWEKKKRIIPKTDEVRKNSRDWLVANYRNTRFQNIA